MLQSKFSKKQNVFCAQKIFTDRTKPTEVFKESVLAIENRPQEIITFYGKGGIGKSSLIKKLLGESLFIYEKNKNLKYNNVFLSLEAFEFSNPVNILTAIRNQLTIDCSIFDYALVQYYAKTKMTIDEIINKNNAISSSVMEILNDVMNIGTGQICIPSFAISKCIDLIKDVRLKKRYKEDIEELAILNEWEIFERLPYYLGLCLNNAADKGEAFVLFFDSYESLINRSQGETASVGREEWFQELFLSGKNIRCVIASRDRLRWDMIDEEWKVYLNQHLLGNLSKEDSRWYLERVPIQEEDIINTIVEKAQGVPLYLDMCVDIYEIEVNKGLEHQFADLKMTNKIIDRYIRHLSEKDKYAVNVLAIPRVFNVEFAKRLLQKENLIYNEDELLTLFAKSIVLPLNTNNSLWKIDQSVRMHMIDALKEDRIQTIMIHVMECIREEWSGKMFPYLASVIELVVDNPKYLAPIREMLFEQIDYYGNAGFSGELHQILESQILSKNETLRSLALMNELVYLRRTSSLEAADEFAKQHLLTKDEMGVWFYLYEYYRIQIRHLRGFYDECIEAYKKLLDEMTLIRTTLPVHIYNIVAMKYADLLFLRGEFEQSLTIVDSILMRDSTSLTDQIELLRIKGHIYRFQGQFEQAELIYKSALNIANDSGLISYEGKIYNNMAEALCMLRPQDALGWFMKSKDINTAIDNGIELGKSFAAASVAHANLNDFEQALWFAEQSLAEALRTKYRSGYGFGLFAKCYCYLKSGNKEQYESVKEELKQLLNEINVYHYILKGVENA